MEVYNAIKMDLGYIIVIIVLLQLTYTVFGIGTDNSDENRFKRSDMKVYTDYGTGNQYISNKNGDLIPRLDIDGKQININKNPEFKD